MVVSYVSSGPVKVCDESVRNAVGGGNVGYGVYVYVVIGVDVVVGVGFVDVVCGVVDMVMFFVLLFLW